MASKRTRNTRAKGYEDSIYIKMPDGTRRREWFTAPTLRELAKEKERRLAQRDEKPRAAARAMTVADGAELFVKRHVDVARSSAQITYRTALVKRIAPHLFTEKLSDLTVERVEEWMSQLVTETQVVKVNGEVVFGPDGLPLRKRVHGDVSINMARATLVLMLNTLMKWGYVNENVAQRASKIKVGSRQVTIYAPAEVEHIAGGMLQRRLDRIGRRGSQGEQREQLLGARDAAMVMVLAFSGVRIGELMALKWMDDGGNELAVRHTVNVTTSTLTLPKSGKQRLFPLLQPVRAALDWWRELAPRTNRHDFIFGADTIAPRPLDAHAWRQRVFVPGVETTGYAEARPHDLRHTFASLMIAKGVSPVTLAEWLGHSDPIITMRTYAHRFAAVESNVVDSVNANIW